MDLTTEQKVALKAAFVADASTSTARSRRDLPTLTNWLNAKTEPATVDVPVPLIREIVMPTGEWAAIKGVAADPLKTKPVRGAAITFIDTLTMLERIPTSKPKAAQAVATMLAALVTDTALSAESRDAMLALMNGRISRFEKVAGFGAVASFDDTIAILGA